MTLAFAYGSNLDEADRRAWCARRGLSDIVGAAVGPAWLPDWELVFDYRSVARGGGACDIRPALGQVVPGVLFEVEDGGAGLDLKEGLGSCYERIAVMVLREGAPTPAFCYRVMASQRRAHCPPTPEYLGVVARGLARWGLPDEQLRAAARGARASLVEGLFVYGTLKRGERAHGRLGEAGARAWPASIPGRLVDCGRYPGLWPAAEEGERVFGEVAPLVDVGLLRGCDDYEGFEGYASPRSEYWRVLCEAQGEGRRARCWTYRLRTWPEGGRRLADGRWSEAG